MTRRFALCVALVAAVGLGLSAGAAQPPAPALFVEPASVAALPAGLTSAPDTVQARAILVNFTALDADGLTLDLAPGEYLRATLERRAVNPDQSESWSGRIDGSPLSAVTFVRTGGVLQGSVRTLEAAYSIEPVAGTPYHAVRQVDLGALGAELPPLVPVLPDELDAPLAADVAADDGTTFDVLVVYTAAARTAAGGTDQAILSRINLGITETNNAYANSGVIPRLRLVGAEFIGYTESGSLENDLSAVTGTSDGQMDSVHARRNALGADLVKLVVGSQAGGACGVAWLMQTLSPGFASNAFSVTAYPCISPNYTFAHELGHNMGSNHAPDDPVTSSPLYPYSFGYKNPGNLFRTVMAYTCSGGCPRVLHFSNPSVNYNGAPTGTQAQHNNALSINNARNTIANWRQAAGPNTAPTISAVGSQVINEDGATSALGFTVGDAETAASSLLVSASSSNTSLVPNTGAALALGGSGATRSLIVTPLANQNGASTITLSVSDGALTTSTTFQLTVNAVNDAPTLTVTPPAASVANGMAAQTTVVVSDIDTPGASLQLSAASNNQTLVPSGSITIAPTATTATSRTFQVTMTPVSGQSGTALVTLTGSDSTLVASQVFTMNVAATGAPAVSPIANQTIDEDGVAGPLAFTISDSDTPVANLTVSAVSTNGSVVPNTAAALALGGTGANRTLTITPPGDANGSTTITVFVNDGSQSASTSFVLTVNAVNDGPVISPVAAQTTAEDQPVTAAFTVTDVDTPASSLQITAVSSNTALVGPGGLVPGGSGGSRLITVTPLANQHGAATITLTVSDGAATAATSFALTVTSVNDPPVVAGAPFLVSTTPGVATTVSLTLTDVDSAGGSLTLAGVTTNPTLLADSGITITPGAVTSTSRAFAVTLAPVAGEMGSGGVVLTASDGTATSTAAMALTVAAAPSAPDAPTSATATAQATSVTIAWTPALTGWAPSGFVVEIGAAPGTTTLPLQVVPVSQLALQMTLPPGTYYTRVRASNDQGTSPASPEAMVSVVDPNPLPGPPGSFGVRTVGTTAILEWLPPATGAPVAGYRIEAGDAPGRANLATLDAPSSTTTLPVPGVPPGTYWIRVRGVNAAGVGPASPDVSLVMGSATGCVGLPASPVLNPPSVSGNTVSLSWTPPAAGGAPATYVLGAGSVPGSSNLAFFSTGSAATSFAGSGPNGLYFVRIAGANACGVGLVSNEVSFTLGPPAPGAPANLSWSLGGGVVTLTWDAPASGGSPAGYVVEAGSASGLANLAVLATGSPGTTFAAAAPAGSYFVRVRSVNAAGTSAASNEVVVVVP